MKRIFCFMALLVFAVLIKFSFAQNGEYDAFVSTENGNYKAVVEVEDGEVVYVRRKNGDQLRLQDAKIIDGHADGTDLDGRQVHIEIVNYNDYYGGAERSEVSPGTAIRESAGSFDKGTGSDVP